MSNKPFYFAAGFFSNTTVQLVGLPLIVPSPLAVLMLFLDHPNAGLGSDMVPPIVTTGDGTAYRDLRDPANIWRTVPSGEPVNSQRQAELTQDWDLQRDRFRAMLPPDLSISLPYPSQTCNRDFNAARSWIAPRDPLVLDLDGDGIETVGIASAAPLLFDMDGDGVKTATGWIQADDGLVVRDLNGNGQIDSGRELFGDQTVLVNGPNAGRKASNGYTALADLDANSNGVIDNADAAYADLRVWRDLNQDGTSQADELKTLGEMGIDSISVVGSPSSVDFGNGNTQPWTATFVRSNGAIGVSGVAELTGSLLLASNGFYREFTDDPVVTASASTLPQMGGSGWVRDLREAMSLGNAKSQCLVATVEAFAAAATRDEQMALIDELLEAWADTTQKMTHAIGVYGIREENGAIVTCDPNETTANADLIVHPSGLEETVNLPTVGPSVVLTPQGAELLRRVNLLEVFNGTKFLQLTSSGTGSGSGGATGGGGSSGGGSSGRAQIHASISTTQIDLLNESYEALVDSVYSLLALQTRLKPFLGSIEVTVDDDGLHLNSAPLAIMLDARKLGDEDNAIIDLIELNRFAQPLFQAANFDGMSKLREWVESLPSSSPLREKFVELLLFQGVTSSGTGGADIYFGNASNNTFNAKAGDDSMQGGAGDDVLRGGEGNDLLEGGTGNDTVDGGEGNNIYLFGRGDGHDRVTGYEDSSPGKFNILKLKPGLSPSDVKLEQVWDNAGGGDHGALQLTISDTNEWIVFPGFFRPDGPINDHNTLQQIRFSDGTVWDMAAIQAKVFGGTTGNDNIYGSALADTLVGQDGADQLYGNDGDDTLRGGTGNDSLGGGAGNDTLDGGAGNDALNGGLGNNTYLFGRGDGNDRVGSYSDSSSGKLNTLQLKAGISPTNVKLEQAWDSTAGASNEALQLTIADTNEWIVFDGFFRPAGPTNAGNTLQQIRFDDGTVWDMATIQAKVFGGTTGNDILYGSALADTLVGQDGADQLNGRDGDDTLRGGAGNDSLGGEGGNDTLDGGAGNDALNGGAGNNTYLFGRGDGNDRVTGSPDSTPGKLNILQLKPGVSRADVKLEQAWDTGAGANAALQLTIRDTNEWIVFDGFFRTGGPSNPDNTLQLIRFDDGTVWDVAMIQAKVYGGTAGNDIIHGSVLADTLAGQEGADQLNGNDGDDTLRGDAGNDSLEGGAGNDTLDGGAGNDALNGGLGNNTYLFGRGDGNDRVAGSPDSTPGKLNILQLKPGVSPADVKLEQAWDTGAGANAALQLTIRDTNEWIVFDGFFRTGGPSNPDNTLQQIRFADGTTWDIAAIQAKLLEGSPPSQGGSGNDTITGTSGNDQIYGGAGSDTLNGAAGHDLLDGGEGNDTLNGQAGDDTLIGAEGNDQLFGHNGNNVFDGGTGNDLLSGETGNQIYLFGRGDGQDIVQSYDATPGKLNILRFDAGIAPADIVVRQAADSWVGGNQALEFSIAGTSDKITINAFFYQDNPNHAYTSVQKVEFADGSSWDLTTILAKAHSGTSGNDTIRGTIGNDTMSGNAGDDTINGVSGDDTIDGGDGADTLRGEAGHDTLVGGSGNDQLFGHNGNNVFDGGTGNDLLSGEAGNQIYLFGRGDGQDIVQSYDATPGKLNILRFDAGIAPEDIVVRQAADSWVGGNQALEFSIAGTSDKITINAFFYQDNPNHAYTSVQKVEFADGSSWDLSTILAKAYSGSSGNDTMRGTIVGDTMIGGAGNDTLSGLGGNDSLSGGIGNDSLNGGTGNDSYRFLRGTGQDTVVDGDSTAGNTDVAWFDTDIASDQLWFRQIGNDLEVSIIGTSDKVTVSGWYQGSQNQLEQFKTSDGKTLTNGNVQNLVQAMASFSPPAAGQTTLPTEYASSLNPVIASNWQ